MKSLPQQLLNELKHVKGFDEAAFIAAHQQPAVTSVRIHPVKGEGVFADNAAVPWCADGRYLDERPVFTLDPYYHAGAYYVQEASSMFLDHLLRQLLPERNNLRVLDLCAAPGGKSTLIASLLEKDSLLISNEVIRTRASILEENMTRWGYMNTWVTSNDPREFGKLPGYFDVIVTDVPCSGSGLFRKDAAALDEWSEANVQLCCERQERILADVWPSLKQDGILIYATCSYSAAEDEQILDALAEEYDVISLQVNVPENWGIVTITSPDHAMTGYCFFPHKVKGEGFFIAALQKKEEAGHMKPAKFKSTHDKKAWEQSKYLLAGDSYACIKAGDEYCAINPLHEQDLQIIEKALYLRKTGLALGSMAKEWLPAHDIALSIDRNKTIQTIKVDAGLALRFLKKEDISGDVAADKGWHIVTYNGLGLGWVKSLGNRFNNYLPKHWRIRMDIGD